MSSQIDKNLDQSIHEILQSLGEDPSREGLKQTPRRVRESLQFLTSGYGKDPVKLAEKALFESESNDLVVVRDIELYSLCEHHLLPFFGKAHIAYLPNKKIIGLSKIARLVDVFARRLQVQERLTHQISTCLQEVLQPHGVGVIIEAHHLCMMMRGVEKQNSKTITSSMLGTFRENEASRKELLHLLNGISLSA